MDKNFLKELAGLAEQFQIANVSQKYSQDISGFKKWIAEQYDNDQLQIRTEDIEWEGKEFGRSPESVISTLLVHLNRYANRYSEAAIMNSDFSTQDDFIYLINLKAFGQMTKSELISKNVHQEYEGNQIIERLEDKGWIHPINPVLSDMHDLVCISAKGEEVLTIQMDEIRKATSRVAGDLTHSERIELIKILTKLELYHQSVFKNCDIRKLLE